MLARSMAATTATLRIVINFPLFISKSTPSVLPKNLG
jgi:hypothetical protein